MDKAFMKSFFNRHFTDDYDSSKKIEIAFEQQLLDEELALFADIDEMTFMVNKFWDFRNFR
jgi:hypothetical protein